MKIRINGTQQETTAANLEALLLELDYDDQSIAIALNGDFVPRSTYLTTPLNQDDDLEVVAPMQGG